MADTVNSFTTNFGRFYNHPKFALQSFKAHTAIGALNGDLGFDPKAPYSPKPSITNIIGMYNKEFLPPYYAKLVAEYAVENLENLQRIVSKFGPDVAVGQLKAIPNLPNPAALVGDEVHAAIDDFVKTRMSGEELAPVAFSTTTAAHMFGQFLHFVSEAKPEFVRSEYTVWSFEHGYAGTGDLMMRLWGDLWLVDTKSGKNVHPEVALQTSAAAHADVFLDPAGNEFPMPPVDVQGVLHVRPRSVKLHKLERTDRAFQAFLACKDLFDWMRHERDFVIQEPYKTEFRKAA